MVKKKSWVEYKKEYLRKDLKAIQLEQIKEFQSLDKEISDFFIGIMEETQFSDNIEKSLKNIEDGLEQQRDKILSGVKQQVKNDVNESVAFENELKQLKNKLIQIQKYIKTSSGIDQNKIKASLTALKFDIKALSNKEKRARIANQLQKGETPKVLETDKALFKSLAGISSDVKGTILELEATKMINKRFEDLSQGLVAVQTGSFKLEGKSIKEDIMIFSQEYWDEISQKFNGTETVRLNEVDYSELQKNMKTAITAKASKDKNNITFHKGISDNTLYKWGAGDQAVCGLKLANQIKKETSETAEALRNYIISKNIQKVMGQKNEIMLHRGKIITTQEFLWNSIAKEGKLLKHSGKDIKLI